MPDPERSQPKTKKAPTGGFGNLLVFIVLLAVTVAAGVATYHLAQHFKPAQRVLPSGEIRAVMPIGHAFLGLAASLISAVACTFVWRKRMHSDASE